MKQNSSSNKYSLTEEKEMILRIRKGDQEAYESFLIANQGIVHLIAKHFAGVGLDYADLIQEGNIGLIKAIQHFDLSMNYRFISYAKYWIMEAITESFRYNLRSVRVPAYLQEKISKLQKIRATQYKTSGHLPSVEELAYASGFSLQTVKRCLEQEKEVLSFDGKKEFEDGSYKEFEYMIEEKQPSVVENYEKKGLKEIIEFLISNMKLSQREKSILCHRYELFGFSYKTQEQLSQEYHISRQRVYAIEKSVLQKFRNEYTYQYIKDYLEQEHVYSIQVQVEHIYFSLRNVYPRKSILVTEELKKMHDYIDEITLETLFSDFSILQLKLICLRYGFIKNMYFSIADIARVLHIKESQVLEILEKIVGIYLASVNDSNSRKRVSKNV